MNNHHYKLSKDASRQMRENYKFIERMKKGAERIKKAPLKKSLNNFIV